jgi:hypothetical protein
MVTFPTYAVYEGLKEGNRFISSFTGDGNDDKLDDGTIAYKILYTGNSIKECQEFLFGVHHNTFTFNEEQIEILQEALLFYTSTYFTAECRKSMTARSLYYQLKFAKEA